MQPHEFYALLDGYQWRQEQQENLFAYFTCQLMNISGRSLKKPITPKELIKPIREPKKTKQDRKQEEEYLKQVFKHTLNGGG